MRQPIVFGKYILLERISVGGMAEVFKAKSFGEEGFEKILAIKRILPSMAEDEEFIEMFIDEAKISGQLSHPNIGQIFELGKIDNSYFIAMEYVWGKDVLQIQNRFRRYRQSMAMSMAVFIASRVCEGLDYAHCKKDETQTPLHIIHRDVSPQNVLVSYSGEVKIIDFGIAKARSRSSKTQAGVLKGKFGYMSPEQVRALPLDQRSDIFSIGTILYEMCTGERLFTGESDFATLEKVRNSIVPAPSKINPKITPDLEQIILKALRKDPDERYTRASELQEDLTNFLMRQSPIFTTKNLAATVSELFSTERVREQGAMERYKQIKREDLNAFSIPPSARREQAISLLPQGPPSAPELFAIDAEPVEDEFDELATQIGGPAFLFDQQQAAAQQAAADAMVLSADDLELVDEGEAHTSIFNESVEAVESLTSEPTFIFNMESGQMVHVAEQPTVIFAGKKGGNGDGRTDLPSQGPTVIFDANLGGVPVTGEISATAAVTLDRPPSLVKDILIGVLVALLVIMGIVVWRVFTASQKATSQTSTLVVSTTPAGGAQILLDGRSRGQIKSGAPFMLENLKPGDHKVGVRVGGAEDVERSVTLTAGQVKVLNLPLPRPAAKGHLVLAIVPSGCRVLIDGAEVSTGAATAPLELKSGVAHDVRIEKDGFEPALFTVTLGAGEKRDHAVTLKAEPTPVPFKIVTRPGGAAIVVDGEKKGTSPATLELRPGPHRIRVDLEGYQAQSESVEVEQGGKAAVTFLLKRLAPAPPESPPDQKPPLDHTAKKPPAEAPEVSANMGFLVANTIPWAKVIVDGKDTGKTTPVAPRSKIPLKPGRHKVTFDVDGKRFDFSIVVEVGKITRLIRKLPVE